MSFWRVYYHLVWSTKNRLPLITPEIETELIGYIVRKTSEVKAFILAISAITDHIHLVVAIPPELSIAQYVKLVKGSSSHYINYTLKPEFSFAWQRGYGVLSMGEKQLHIATEYVKNQRDHHANQTTISWLERSMEENEGPKSPGMHSVNRPDRLREEMGIYTIGSESPF